VLVKDRKKLSVRNARSKEEERLRDAAVLHWSGYAKEKESLGRRNCSKG
jgi:hypothetical protein